MIQHIGTPAVISGAGLKKKLIEEYFGRVNTNTDMVSIAHMKSPAGWIEPGQQPEFDEYTVVLAGTLQVETETQVYQVSAGQGILVTKNEWVKYSSPQEGGAEYISVCIPAFSPATVHRDKE